MYAFKPHFRPHYGPLMLIWLMGERYSYDLSLTAVAVSVVYGLWGCIAFQLSRRTYHYIGSRFWLMHLCLFAAFLAWQSVPLLFPAPEIPYYAETDRQLLSSMSTITGFSIAFRLHYGSWNG